MSRYVDLSEKVTATFFDEEYEEWSKQTVTVADILDSVCDGYTVLPSAQPERMRGKWMRYGEDGNPNEEDTVFWQCDQCLETYTGRTTRIPNYCPNCGAYMKGGEDEFD